MAEAIVDLVATGKTLKENGLIRIEDLFYSTARLIGNPLSMRLDDNYLRDTILSIELNNGL
jgi:ATP phosphoribosyltransferase